MLHPQNHEANRFFFDKNKWDPNSWGTSRVTPGPGLVQSPEGIDRRRSRFRASSEQTLHGVAALWRHGNGVTSHVAATRYLAVYNERKVVAGEQSAGRSNRDRSLTAGLKRVDREIVRDFEKKEKFLCVYDWNKRFFFTSGWFLDFFLKIFERCTWTRFSDFYTKSFQNRKVVSDFIIVVCRLMQ